ncbi:hypothetical protein MPNT_40062 [Candidatus Methylacidithermus pantelleriae]|uniref:Uncharacterized protein n=1 Tax=Candidatus Methylacidithermus pantelleriae TaxID=2744239 RepID=A0A8J2BN57_9BACT|nr:hypothetical protein MPNT_40062 [Candidatus Methylacidithermus pantelleriae]
MLKNRLALPARLLGCLWTVGGLGVLGSPRPTRRMDRPVSTLLAYRKQTVSESVSIGTPPAGTMDEFFLLAGGGS